MSWADDMGISEYDYDEECKYMNDQIDFYLEKSDEELIEGLEYTLKHQAHTSNSFTHLVKNIYSSYNQHKKSLSEKQRLCLVKYIIFNDVI